MIFQKENNENCNLLAPAEPSPAPGEVLGGDFEDPMAWSQGLSVGGVAEVREGVGLAGSNGGHLSSSACYGFATLETKISIPQTDLGQAIETVGVVEPHQRAVIGNLGPLQSRSIGRQARSGHLRTDA